MGLLYWIKEEEKWIRHKETEKHGRKKKWKKEGYALNYDVLTKIKSYKLNYDVACHIYVYKCHIINLADNFNGLKYKT